jgi:hypothetical protein
MNLLSAPDFWLNLTRLAALLFTGFIGWLTYRSHVLLKQFQPDFNLLLSIPETIGRIVMVLICLLLAWLSGLPAAKLGLVVENLWRSIGLGFGVGLVTQLVVNILTIRAIMRFGPHIYSPWLIRNILPRHRGQWMPIALAFIPPVAMEELLFRTLLIGLFRDLIPLSVLVTGTSLIFGLMHRPQGTLGIIMAGAINILFCLIFIWSGELLVTLAAHYTVNLLQVIAAYYQQDLLEHLTSGPSKF